MKKAPRRFLKSVISGIVIPAQWDENGKVISVNIHTDDENAFLVERTRIGNELLNFIRRKVEVTGKLRERIDGQTSISIKSYKSAEEQSEETIAQSELNS